MTRDLSVTPQPDRRCLALWLPYLATDRIRRRERAGGAQAATGVPLALVARIKGGFRLAAVDAIARGLGLTPGMALADARALRPGLSLADADPAADARLILAIADWARRYTPLAAVDGTDGVVLDITGCTHLFGGEAALLADVLRRLAMQGFSHPRAAIAGTPEAAWALARHAPEARRLCPPGGEEAALRPLGVAALNLPPETVTGLTTAGLARIEDIWLRPRAPIAARFGAGVIARLEAAFGLRRSPITPRLEAPPYVTERRFFDPILTNDDVTRTIARLCAEMARLLESHGDGARRLELMLFRVDGTCIRSKVGASRPTRDPAAMAALFRERLGQGLDEREIAYGFDVVRLSVMEAARIDEAPLSLDSESRDGDLHRLVDRLGARLGEAAVQQLVAADAHLPEEAAQAVPVARTSPVRRSSPQWNPTRDPGEPPDRPILLFDEPEPIETLAGVPDGPPLRFRWRRVLHDIAAVEGPERLVRPWWNTVGPPSPLAGARDYFRAEDRQGRRFWLYREGLYPDAGLPATVAGQEGTPPRWFVHGLFG